MRTPSVFSLLLLLLISTACGNSTADTDDETTEVETTPTETPMERVDQPTSAPPPAVLTEGEEEIAAPSEPITRIREEYARIRRRLELEVLRADVKKFACANEPGDGQLTRYYDDDKLVMLELAEGREHSWEKQTIYFYEDGRPFFVFEEVGSWGFGGPLNEEAPNTIDKITENRYYLEDGNVIRQLTKSYEQRSWEDGPESDEIANEPVPEAVGKDYARMPAIPQIKMGNVGC